MANIGGGRQIKFCPVCREADDHPRHVIYTGVGGVTAEPHMDCCTSVGCPDKSCEVITTHARGLRGADLHDHILANGEELNRLIKERQDGD